MCIEEEIIINKLLRNVIHKKYITTILENNTVINNCMFINKRNVIYIGRGDIYLRAENENDLKVFFNLV